MKDVSRMATVAFKREGDDVILIGETKGHLGQSIYLREIEGKEEGAPPPVDLAVEKRNGDFVRNLIEQGKVDTAHDLSDGGLLVAVAEMSLAGDIGITLEQKSIAALFGEDQARYAISVAKEQADFILKLAQDAGVPAFLVGETGGDRIRMKGMQQDIPLAQLRKVHEGWFPAYMSAPHTN
jgi:phosphoribosylformylglycinamidine synthase